MAFPDLLLRALIQRELIASEPFLMARMEKEGAHPSVAREALSRLEGDGIAARFPARLSRAPYFILNPGWSSPSLKRSKL